MANVGFWDDTVIYTDEKGNEHKAFIVKKWSESSANLAVLTDGTNDLMNKDEKGVVVTNTCLTWRTSVMRKDLSRDEYRDSSWNNTWRFSPSGMR